MQSTDAVAVPHRDTFPLVGDLSTVEGMVGAVRQILLKPTAAVQAIHITATGGISVEWDGLAEDTMTLGEDRVDLASMLLDVVMDEVDGSDPASALGTAAMLAEASGGVITHALIGSKSVLWRWLGVEESDHRPLYVGGGLIQSSPNISRDELFLFTGPASAAPATSCTRVTRVFMETK